MEPSTVCRFVGILVFNPWAHVPWRNPLWHWRSGILYPFTHTVSTWFWVFFCSLADVSKSIKQMRSLKAKSFYVEENDTSTNMCKPPRKSWIRNDLDAANKNNNLLLKEHHNPQKTEFKKFLDLVEKPPAKSVRCNETLYKLWHFSTYTNLNWCIPILVSTSLESLAVAPFATSA